MRILYNNRYLLEIICITSLSSIFEQEHGFRPSVFWRDFGGLRQKHLVNVIQCPGPNSNTKICIAIYAFIHYFSLEKNHFSLKRNHFSLKKNYISLKENYIDFCLKKNQTFFFKEKLFSFTEKSFFFKEK